MGDQVPGWHMVLACLAVACWLAACTLATAAASAPRRTVRRRPRYVGRHGEGRVIA
ncbi:hypothetical protein [Actinomadura sp. KC216]|uniref:hypothetical protein n=1 Tax=Actinomadura sp. KC216 TaxID=2530370 RepID=UPI0014050811|nr:hypothetical protein [Actinomadura sp. KC216]